jgi:hypothetical protein
MVIQYENQSLGYFDADVISSEGAYNTGLVFFFSPSDSAGDSLIKVWELERSFTALSIIREPDTITAAATKTLI